MKIKYQNAIAAGNPPTADGITRDIAEKEHEIERYLKRVSMGAFGIGTVLFLLATAMSRGWMEDLPVIKHLAYLIAAGMVGLAASGAQAFARRNYDGWSVVVVLLVACALAVLWSEPAILAMIIGFCGLFVISLTVNILVRDINALDELDPESQPDECIALDQWRKQDDHIDAYLRAIAAQQRKPVFAEYQAAKQWMESAEERQKLDRARAACERFT